MGLMILSDLTWIFQNQIGLYMKRCEMELLLNGNGKSNGVISGDLD